MLSTSDRIPHLVQLLLTMEPSIVERAAVLLHAHTQCTTHAVHTSPRCTADLVHHVWLQVLLTRLSEDNPLLPRMYLTGAFFFALMYTGSNVLPIIRFLRAAHMLQLYRDEENEPPSGISGRSFLCLMLPKAMVCCLEV